MHKIIEYVCEELEALEKKAAKGSMTMSEVEYASKLADLKKNLLKGDMLYDEVMGDGYSERMMGGGAPYARGGDLGGGSQTNRGSYARGRGRNARRDSMGRYSSDGYSRSADDMVEQLRDLMEDAPDDSTRREIEKLVRKMESM